MKKILTILFLMIAGFSAFAVDVDYSEECHSYISIYREGDNLHDVYNWYWENDLSKEEYLITFYWTQTSIESLFPEYDIPEDFVKIDYLVEVTDSDSTIDFRYECLKFGDTYHIYAMLSSILAIKALETELSVRNARIIQR